MAKKSKKALGAAMAGVMAVGAVAGTANTVVTQVQADVASDVKAAQAKLDHLSYSLHNNYLGLKNQPTWEIYAKDAQNLINKLPKGSARTTCQERLDRANAMILAAASVNHAEFSIQKNFPKADNANQWKAYTEKALANIKKVDEGKEYSDRTPILQSRIEKVNAFADLVLKLEDARQAKDAAAMDALKGEAADLMTYFRDEMKYKDLMAYDLVDVIDQRIEEAGGLVEEDTEAPVLTVDGEKEITVENGAELKLPVVTATDNKDEAVEVTSVIKDANGNEIEKIDTTVAGVYTVTYSAEDEAGNKAEDVVVTVTVKEAVDAEAPVLSVDGETEITVENGAEVKLPVVTATDNKDEAVEVTSVIKDANGNEIEKIDTTVAGVYTVTYSAIDAAGNKAEDVVVTVTVKEVKLAVQSVSAINGKVTVSFNKEVAEVPANIVVLKGEEALDLSADKFVLVDGKIEVTVPTIEVTGEDQSVVYSVKLGDAEAVSAEAVVVAGDKEAPAAPVVKGVTDGDKTNNDVTPAVDTVEGVEISAVLEKDGVKVDEYKLGDAVTEEGTYKLTVTATKNINGKTTDTVVNFVIDKTAPELSAMTTGENPVEIGEAVQLENLATTYSFTVKTEDGLVPVVKVGENVLEAVEGVYTVDLANTTEAVTVSIAVADAVGNEATKSFTVTPDAQVAVVEEANVAVSAYEVATIEKYNDIASVAKFKADAEAAVEKVTNEEAKTALSDRMSAKETELNKLLNGKLAAINDATNQVSLLEALGFFNGVSSDKILTYDAEFGGTKVNTSLDTVQNRIYELNLVEKMNVAITDVDGTNTVNQLKLKEAIQYGVDVKLLTGVDFDRYFDQYISVAKGYTAVTEFDTAAEIQSSMIDNAKTQQVSDATAAVVSAEATPNAELIAAAEKAVNALPEDIAPDTTKADLIARIDAIRPVAPVLAAKATGLQSQLLEALKSEAFVRVNPDSIVAYMSGIVSTDNTVAKIQGKIDTANLSAAQTAVADSEASELTAAKVLKAQKLVNVLPEDVAPDTTKADLQNRVDVVNALLAVDSAAVSNAAGVLTVLQNNAKMLGLEGASAVNPAYADYYKTALYAGDQGTRDTAAKVQALISGVNSARLTAASEAVAEAEKPTLTATKVATAQALVDAMPEDVESTTTKADLQNRLDVVNALLAIDSAVTAADATDASVLKVLQANAKVLDLTINTELAAEYKVALSKGDQTTRDTAAKVQGLIATVNSPDGALTALKESGDNADKQLALLQAKTLNIKGLVEANKDAYFADKDAFTTAATVGEGDDSAAKAIERVQAVVNGVNALVDFNKATTSTDARAALTTFALNITHATSTTYLNLNSTAKLELAELMLADIASNEAYANIEAVQTAITAKITERNELISGVNDACDTTKTIIGVRDALEKVGYEAFNNLEAAIKLEVAEKFLDAYPKNSDGDAVADYFTSITAVKSAIDAAIAAK